MFLFDRENVSPRACLESRLVHTVLCDDPLLFRKTDGSVRGVDSGNSDEKYNSNGNSNRNSNRDHDDINLNVERFDGKLHLEKVMTIEKVMALIISKAKKLLINALTLKCQRQC